MPIIPQLSQSIKMAKSTSGGMPAAASAAIDGNSQAAIAGSSLQPVGFKPGVIPVIPFGIALSIIMTKIEALMFKSFDDIESISKNMMVKYDADVAKVEIQQSIAENKLYNDLKTRQLEIKDELVELENELDEINKTIPELEKEQNDEMEKYLATIFNIKDKAKKAEADGNIEEKDRLIESINIHDDWLADIIKISVEIITLKLRIPSLENEIEEKRELTEIVILNNWDSNILIADRFEVAIPNRPDTPARPNFPNASPIPKQNEIVKASSKAYAKWLVTPAILPTGIPLATILLYSQSQAPVSLKNCSSIRIRS